MKHNEGQIHVCAFDVHFAREKTARLTFLVHQKGKSDFLPSVKHSYISHVINIGSKERHVTVVKKQCGFFCVFLCVFFLFSLTSLSRLFRSYRDESIGRWGETGVPRENHLPQPQAELGLSHMWPVRGSNLLQTQR